MYEKHIFKNTLQKKKINNLVNKDKMNLFSKENKKTYFIKKCSLDYILLCYGVIAFSTLKYYVMICQYWSVQEQKADDGHTEDDDKVTIKRTAA